MKKQSIAIYLLSILLILLGLYLVMSASSVHSSQKFNNMFYLFQNHFIKVVLGILFLSVTALVPYDIYKKYSKVLMSLSILLLILTLFMASSVKGAKRWIDFGIISFQPADIARITLIIHMAALISQKEALIDNFKRGVAPSLFWLFSVIILLVLQPNFSNAVLLFITGIIILFVSGARLKHLSAVVTFAGVGLVGLMMLFQHSRERLFNFVESLFHGGSQNLQVTQAIIGLGSGGLTGVGIGYSKQRNFFIPEPFGDFIFAILGEETGYIGAVIVILIYLIIFLLGIWIAKNAPDKFSQILAFGISFSFIAYAFVNIGVASGLLPTTGLPLPFISYGGTSIILICISIGILLNIGFNSEKVKQQQLAVEQK